jgi:peptidoglycan/xylan/chitin deacetylase (PgdA/CDA1 family)
MADVRLLPDSALAERRRRRRDRRRRRRVGGGAALAATACLLVGVGVLDGGSATEPSHASGDTVAAPAPPAPRQILGPARPTRAEREGQAIDRALAAVPYVSAGGGRRREIALTFDDGPGPYTERIVAVLQRMRVPATFFQIGVDERRFADTEARQVADPRLVVLANHTYGHVSLDRLARRDQAAQIDEQSAILRSAGAPEPRLFRPPYGRFDSATLDVLRERRMLMVLWSVDSEDYRRPGTDAIVRRVLDGARPGAIVLMHDAGGDRSQTLAALPRIVRGLRARRYRLVTVPRLMLDDPPRAAQRRPATGVG